MADKKKPKKDDLDEYGFPKTYDESGYRTTSPEEAEVKRQAILKLAQQNQGPYGGRNQDTLDQAMLEASQLPAQAPTPAQLSGGVRAATGAPTPMPPAPNPLDLSNAVRQQTGQPQLPPPSGMWAGGTAGGPAAMAKGGKVKKFRQDLNAELSDEDYSKHQASMDNAKKIIAHAKASGFDKRAAQHMAAGGHVGHYPPVDQPAQVPGIEMQQQMEAKKHAIHKMADGGRVGMGDVRKAESKDPQEMDKMSPEAIKYEQDASDEYYNLIRPGSVKSKDSSYSDGGEIGNPAPDPTPEFQQTREERESEAEEYTRREDERKFEDDEETKAKKEALERMKGN